MLTICDTHPLLYLAQDARRLSSVALGTMESAARSGDLACAGISLWEIAMLIEKHRIQVVPPVREFLETLVLSRRIRVMPITPDVAALSSSGIIRHGDPADRLIAATALAHGAPLITKDQHLRAIPGLRTIW